MIFITNKFSNLPTFCEMILREFRKNKFKTFVLEVVNLLKLNLRK